MVIFRDLFKDEPLFGYNFSGNRGKKIVLHIFPDAWADHGITRANLKARLEQVIKAIHMRKRRRKMYLKRAVEAAMAYFRIVRY